jgi:adenylate cyclase class 2
MRTYEVEVKYPLSDPGPIRRQLAKLGAVPGSPLAQCDTYFAHPVHDFSKTDEAFRLRCIGDQNALTYKGPLVDKQTKTREEIEIPIESGAGAARQMEEMLRALGFHAVRSVEKMRQPFHLSWQDRKFELALDRVAGLGQFLEIETQADAAEWEAARDTLLALASALGLLQSERRSYLQLLLEGAGRVIEGHESSDLPGAAGCCEKENQPGE